MYKTIALVLCLGLSITTQAQFGKLLETAKKTILDDSSSGDIGSGLKQALEIGVGDAVKSLSAEKGYLESPYKILVPEEAKKVTSKLAMVPGFQNVEKDLIDKMNQAAEIAAKKATPIFIDAIKQMSFRDATDILFGDADAATRYLESSSRQSLYKEFLPVIQASLDEVNARTYWQDAVSAYNKIPFTKDLNPALDDHVNQRALDGMFSLIQEKETGIRGDKSLRTTPLLKDVFGKLDE